MKIRLHGVDNVIKKLNQLENRVKEIERTHQVSVFELMTPGFMKGHTKFTSSEEMLWKGGFKVEK